MMKKTWLIPASIVGLVALYAILYAWQPGGVRLLKILSDTLFCDIRFVCYGLGIESKPEVRAGCSVAPRVAALWHRDGCLDRAQFLWTFYHAFLDQVEPYPSFADLLWAIGYIPVLASLVLQYRALGVETSLRLKLTVLAAYSVALVVAFVILLWPHSPTQAKLPP